MNVTDNGWPALDAAPGPTFVAAGEGGAHDVASPELAVLFAYVVMRWHTEIEPVTACFGGRTTGENDKVHGAPFSNHISFTAIDVNGARHPYELRGGRWSSGFTPAGLATLRAILAETEVLQWGGDFDSPYRDAMHVQVRQDFTNYRPNGPRPRVVSEADVAAAAGRVGAWVKKVQASVGAVEDGVAGPGYVDAVKAWQTAHGLLADGVFGAKSQAAAGWGGAKPVPAPAPAAQHGNDVSNHQTVGQWQVLDPQFLIAKSTEGLSWRDPSYAAHIGAARAARLLGGQGAYLYVWPEYDPVACCTSFLAISDLRAGEWGVIDFEPYMSKSNPATWAAWVCAFAAEYRRRRGEWPWLYLNDDMASRLLAVATPAQAQLLRCLPLWKARYSSTPGSLYGWPRLEAWQYTGTGVDANWRYSAASPTPTRPTPPKPAPKPDPRVQAIQRAVGVTADGIYGPATTEAVKELQRRLNFTGARLTVDGVYGPATDRARDRFCDGVLGKQTIRLWQHNAGTPIDGKISRPSTLVAKVQRVDSESAAVRPQYKLTGREVDGVLGPNTWRMLQDLMGIRVTGIADKATKADLQRRLLRGRW